MEEQEKKFGLVEILFGVFVTISLDIISIIADVIGVDLGWLIQIPAWLIFVLWFYFKGCRATATLAKRFVIPILIQTLPDWLLPFQLTILFLVTAYMENHPEKFGALQAVGEAASGHGADAAAKLPVVGAARETAAAA